MGKNPAPHESYEYLNKTLLHGVQNALYFKDLSLRHIIRKTPTETSAKGVIRLVREDSLVVSEPGSLILF